METANSLQEKNVVSPFSPNWANSDTYPSPHSHTVAQNAWFEAIATLAVPSHTLQQKDFHLDLNKPVATLWADSNEHLKEKEESSNQYSRLDTRHLPTLRHSWCLCNVIEMVW